ncbi:hypothetical protein WCP94_000072 (plasmid) [Bilophila wadsworthia]
MFFSGYLVQPLFSLNIWKNNRLHMYSAILKKGLIGFAGGPYAEGMRIIP